MKYLKYILFSLLVFSPALAKEDFSLRFKNENEVIYTPSDWVKISEEGAFDFYVSKVTPKIDHTHHRVFSLVEFAEPRKYQSLNSPVKRIFSFGIMDCENAVFYLLTDIYTDSNNNIIFVADYKSNPEVVEVSTPDTPRNKAFIKVCFVGLET